MMLKHCMMRPMPIKGPSIIFLRQRSGNWPLPWKIKGVPAILPERESLFDQLRMRRKVCWKNFQVYVAADVDMKHAVNGTMI